MPSDKWQERNNIYPHSRERFILFLIVLIILVGVLLWRMIALTVFERGFLEQQGNARSLRTIEIPAYRGMITDRHGSPLAMSSPVEAIWINPHEMDLNNPNLAKLAENLGLSVVELREKVANQTKEFIYLRRGVAPMIADEIRKLSIPGVHWQKEFKRYYPDGESVAQLIGFTNIDDQGQEGLELAYNNWLKGEAGLQQVLKDRLGHPIADVQRLKEPKAGKNLMLSIDRQIQYVAYRELKKAVARLKASSGTVVVLDAKTGEVLAMANQPSYNPNNRAEISSSRIRNRALTDTFEPGSVMKAFSVASALASEKYTPETKVETNPGWISVKGRRTLITDEHPGGDMTVTRILQKSSNVGVTKMMLSLPLNQLPDILRQLGFGQSLNTGFPGESPGVLPGQQIWSPSAIATLAFGYGLSVTASQLAHGYSIFANHGKLLPISLLLKHNHTESGVAVMKEKAADEMLLMLEAVVEGGSGTLAKVNGYRVGGKTGTSRIVGKTGYEKDHHIATFAGLAPVSNPRLVVIVVIEDPKLGGISYYAATAAAPVFSKVVANSLQILNVPYDNLISESAKAKK